MSGGSGLLVLGERSCTSLVLSENLNGWAPLEEKSGLLRGLTGSDRAICGLKGVKVLRGRDLPKLSARFSESRLMELRGLPCGIDRRISDSFLFSSSFSKFRLSAKLS